MKVIIAPSKTMKYQKSNFECTPLLYPNETNYLHSILMNYNDEKLCELMKISYKQALKVYDYFHQEYPIHPALSLYQGTVFKQLHLEMYEEHSHYLNQHFNILSAYYGILKYNTGITPYRLDMTMKPDHINLYEYWYTPIYQYFENEDLIISLASQEFTSMIHHPHLYFIDFIEMKHDKIRRNAMIIKKARGKMLDQMILKEITTLDEIKNLNIDGFIYDNTLSSNQTLTFVKKE